MLDHVISHGILPKRRGEASIALVHAWIVLLPIRLFLAAGWLRAAAEKVFEPTWFDGDPIRTFLTRGLDAAPLWWQPVMEFVLLPAAQPFAIAVFIGQIATAVGLVLGLWLRVALWGGIVMNVAFMLCGAVNPSVFYLLFEISLLMALDAGLMGWRRKRPWRPTKIDAAAWLLLVVLMVPSIRTIDPHHVIEDPGAVFACIGAILAITTFLAALSVERLGGPVAPILDPAVDGAVPVPVAAAGGGRAQPRKAGETADSAGR